MEEYAAADDVTWSKLFPALISNLPVCGDDDDVAGVPVTGVAVVVLVLPESDRCESLVDDALLLHLVPAAAAKAAEPPPDDDGETTGLPVVDCSLECCECE